MSTRALAVSALLTLASSARSEGWNMSSGNGSVRSSVAQATYGSGCNGGAQMYAAPAPSYGCGGAQMYSAPPQSYGCGGAQMYSAPPQSYGCNGGGTSYSAPPSYSNGTAYAMGPRRYASAPVYSAPVYSAPVYSAPTYAAAPVYSAPVYSAPVYSAPAYFAPSYVNVRGGPRFRAGFSAGVSFGGGRVVTCGPGG